MITGEYYCTYKKKVKNKKCLSPVSNKQSQLIIDWNGYFIVFFA